MTNTTFSTLPAEIHVSIAKYSTSKDLANLCLAAKWLNESLVSVLYRHVDLEVDQVVVGSDHEHDHMWKACKRQEQFVSTLLSHPEFGKHVRSFKGALSLPYSSMWRGRSEAMISYEELWRAMQSLTHVQHAEVGYKKEYVSCVTEAEKQIPCKLFQSATSVKLIGCMQYALAKSVLRAINPAILKYLCLDMVQDRRIRRPGEIGEDGRLIARGATSGLLTPLTGHCIALRTLTLRRIGQKRENNRENMEWHAGAEVASYVEWASFIRSVKGTVEKLKFEQAERWARSRWLPQTYRPFRAMDERFRRFVLPEIVSGDWACLAMLELRGVRGSKDHGGTTGLTMELNAVLGKNTTILVEEFAYFNGQI